MTKEEAQARIDELGRSCPMHEVHVVENVPETVMTALTKADLVPRLLWVSPDKKVYPTTNAIKRVAPEYWQEITTLMAVMRGDAPPSESTGEEK